MNLNNCFFMCAVSFSLLMSSPAFTIPKLTDLSFPHLNTSAALHLGSQGVSYMSGREGMSQEYHRKFSEYKQAAQAGKPDAQYSLAVAYEYGMGVSKNEALALQWYQKSAKQNYVNAQSRLGLAYSKGQLGLKANIHASDAWFDKAAANQQGHREMLNRMQ